MNLICQFILTTGCLLWSSAHVAFGFAIYPSSQQQQQQSLSRSQSAVQASRIQLQRQQNGTPVLSASAHDSLPDIILSVIPINLVDGILGSVQNLMGEEQQQPMLVAAAGAVGTFWLFLTSSSVFVPSSLLNGKALASIVEGTFLEGKELDCVYKATRDGWSAMNFHNAVDERGSAVVVVKSSSLLGGKVFGGYNPAGWRSTDDYILSSSAFLWSTTTTIPSNNRMMIQKYPISSAGNAAIFDYATSGPNFGSVDLQIGPPRAAVMGGFAGPDMENVGVNAGNLRQCKALPGYAYNTDTRWPVRGNCVLVEVEVYCKKN